MPRNIEVAAFGDQGRIHELMSAVWNNEEPCLQIDGVRTIDQLFVVFAGLRRAAPNGFSHQYRINSAFYQGAALGAGPHIDEGFAGVAVHYNISDILPCTFATARQWHKSLIGVDGFPNVFNTDEVINTREGETVPGRVTIFSEGNGSELDRPFPGLLPTVHYFDRRGIQHTGQWTRYAFRPDKQFGLVIPRHTRDVRRVASTSIAAIISHNREDHTIVSTPF